MTRAALPVLASLLAGLGVALAQRVPGYDLHVGLAFLLALGVRLLLGRDGRRLLPRRMLAALLGTLVALSVPFLLAHAGQGERALPALLAVLSALATVALLARLDAFGAFWLVLLSSTHAAGACYVEHDVAGLVLVPLYVGALAATLLVLERRVSTERSARVAGRTLVLGDARHAATPAFARVALQLVALGWVVGAAIWFVSPRPAETSAPLPLPAGGQDAGAAASDRAATAGADAGVQARVGPDEGEQGAVIGNVGRIKEDYRVHLELRLLAGPEEPGFALRQDVLEVWSDVPDPARTGWRSSPARGGAASFTWAPDGWVTLNGTSPPGASRRYSLTLRQPRDLLYLEPEALRVRIRVPGREREDETGQPVGPLRPLLLSLVRRASEELRPARRLTAGTEIEAVSVPQPRDEDDLRRHVRRGVAPPPAATLTIEAALADALRAASADVEGVRSVEPYARARALERWLKGPEFTYALESPRLSADGRVLDFLTRVRRGNCEWFATSLTLLLRAHGLPARYVRGYWGGSHSPNSALWTFSGMDYHAWTELHLEGHGWVPLNPTPPDRLAVDVETRTEPSAAHPDRGTAPPGPLEEPAGSRVRRWLRVAVSERLLPLLARLFGREGFYAGWWLPTLLLLRFTARRRAHAGTSPGRPATTPSPANDAYRRALAVLEAQGHPRRTGQTARQFLEHVRAGLPSAAAAALGELTQGHERARYAGASDDPRTSSAALGALERALRSVPPA